LKRGVTCREADYLGGEGELRNQRVYEEGKLWAPVLGSEKKGRCLPRDAERIKKRVSRIDDLNRDPGREGERRRVRVKKPPPKK